jgi:vanillate O-demethylase ferredoxin subunit
MHVSWLTLRVVRKWSEATDIMSFELADPEGADLPPFTAGSHVDVEVRPGLVRQYSLCNNPQRRDRYQIAVLRETQSRGGSAAMAEEIRQGMLVRVSEPRNHFALDPTARRSVLIAGGIGVTPILCMAERLHDTGQAFALHYACRSPDRAAFRQRLIASPFSDRVHFHFDDGAEEQRLDFERVLAGPNPQTHLYVCGPPGLIEVVLAQAKALGWGDGQVHREFFAHAPAEASLSDGAFRIELSSSGRVFEVPEDRSITQVLSEHGVDIPVSCEQGVCGTCLTRVLQGQPDHRDFLLTPEEQARNDIMTLCCSRAKSPLLVLDL